MEKLAIQNPRKTRKKNWLSLCNWRVYRKKVDKYCFRRPKKRNRRKGVSKKSLT
jgi:hypothetical protein